MADDWDTGAEWEGGAQDKVRVHMWLGAGATSERTATDARAQYNKFDPMAAVGGPPANTEVVRATDKPTVAPVSFGEVDRIAANLQSVSVSEPAPKPVFKPAPAASPKAAAALSPKAATAPAPAPAPKAAPAPPPSAAPAVPVPASAQVEVSAPRTFSSRLDVPAGESGAFTDKLSPEALAYFNEVCKRPFSQQAVAFMNAYWAEVGSQAEYAPAGAPAGAPVVAHTHARTQVHLQRRLGQDEGRRPVQQGHPIRARAFRVERDAPPPRPGTDARSSTTRAATWS